MKGKMDLKKYKLEEKDDQELQEKVKQEKIKMAVRNYHEPKSEILKEKLEWFKDQKFGLMIHWGLYCQMGIKESWPLVDNDWTKWQFKPGTPNIEVKEMYSQLHRGFLPLRFDPDEWADTAYSAGFRYLVFTTKHHDGFCMWDTKTTDYKVTGPDVPYNDNKNADVTKVLFNAFRSRGMGISAYYSRADFDCPYYWEPGYRWKDGTVRVPSYDPEKKPDLWKKYQDFVYAQLKELITEYGKIDSLWYDGGCDGVQLGLPEMTEKLREYQPDMLGVIRGGQGICEDIVTPELVIPKHKLDVPWELCTCMGKNFPEYNTVHTSFGYSYDQDYMSAKEVAHLLLDVISKGGNLALNLAPQPDGRLPVRAVRELNVLAKWMSVFGDGIYETRPVKPYRVRNWAFTGTKNGSKIFAFYLYGKNAKGMKTYHIPVKEVSVSGVTDMRTGMKLAFRQDEKGIFIELPGILASREPDIADCFVLDTKD